MREAYFIPKINFMKKSYHIELGGELFIFDPIAETILENYLNALRDFYQKEEGGEEIMTDIENRVAELLNDRLKNKTNKVVSQEDAESVIAVMGTLDDLFADPTAESTTESQDPQSPPPPLPQQPITHKRLYRDTEHRLIGGVASGFSYYLNIDVVWIRLALVVLLMLFCGLIFWVYIIAWIIIPAARSATDKLNMRGNPINVSNIARERTESTTDKNRQSSDLRCRLGQSFHAFWKVGGPIIIRILNVLSIILCSVILVSSLIAFLMLSYLFFFMNHFPWSDVLGSWDFGIGSLGIFIGISLLGLFPFILLSYLALRFLVDRERKLWAPILIVVLLIGIVGMAIFYCNMNVTTRIEKHMTTPMPTNSISVTHSPWIVTNFLDSNHENSCRLRFF